MSDPRPLLAPREAAARLGLKEETLKQWRRREPAKLPFVRVGGVIRYQQADIEAFISANRSMSEAA